jgi:hypothetical protein
MNDECVPKISETSLCEGTFDCFYWVIFSTFNYITQKQAIDIIKSEIHYTLNLITIETIAPYFPAIITAVAAIIIAIWTRRFENRRYKTTVLMNVFDRLNDPMHREARRIIFGEPPTEYSYRILGIPKGPDVEANLMNTVASQIARADFNEIGTLYHHELVNKNIFLEEFYWPILRVWNETKREILDRRRYYLDYMVNFERLKDDAEKYADDQNKKKPSMKKSEELSNQRSDNVRSDNVHQKSEAKD